LVTDLFPLLLQVLPLASLLNLGGLGSLTLIPKDKKIRLPCFVVPWGIFSVRMWGIGNSIVLSDPSLGLSFL